MNQPIDWEERLFECAITIENLTSAPKDGQLYFSIKELPGNVAALYDDVKLKALLSTIRKETTSEARSRVGDILKMVQEETTRSRTDKTDIDIKKIEEKVKDVISSLTL